MTADRGAYSDTKVPAERSMSEIRELVMAHGGVGWQVTEVAQGFEVAFGWIRNGRQLLVKLPVMFDYRWCKTQQHRDQERRSKWRSLFYYLKAVYDAIDKRIVLQEQAFMGDLVMRLPNGQAVRVVDAMLPQLAAGRSPDLTALAPMLAAGEPEERAVEVEVVTNPEIKRRFQ